MNTERTLECHLIIYVLLITWGKIHRETCRTNCSRRLERVCSQTQLCYFQTSKL